MPSIASLLMWTDLRFAVRALLWSDWRLEEGATKGGQRIYRAYLVIVALWLGFWILLAIKVVS
jgi:hypothetical protein